MNNSQYEIAADALKITVDEARKYSKDIPSSKAIYVWSPARGGLAVIVAQDGSKLMAGSAVKFDDHLKTFESGRRN